MTPVIELLSRVTIFTGLDRPALDDLGGCVQAQHFAKDAVIVGRDSRGDALFIVESGRVKVVLYGDNGREIILSIFRNGDFFGEMSLLDGQPRSATVIAMEPAHVLVLSRDDFVRHLALYPGTALKILAEMSRRLRKADEIIGDLALLDVYGRVARVLLELGRRDGVRTDEGVLVRVRPTQQDLASMVGTSRETISRALSEFQRRGFLFMQGKSLLLSYGFAEQTLGPASGQ